MTKDTLALELDNLRARCEFYRQILELGNHDDVEMVVSSALRLGAEAANAHCGYLELFDHDGAAAFSLSYAPSETERESFERRISRSVIREAMDRGETVSSASALEDPRFADQGSVKRHRIDAVLCAPIGGDEPFGVFYLQGRDEKGPFPEPVRATVEEFVRHLAPFVQRFVARSDSLDPTRPHREQLRADNVIGRSHAMAKVLEQAAVVAPHRVSVLLTGATGTGKTQLARVIHDSGPRAGEAFVELNCAALPESLFENELFGSVEGGHSTATAASQGKAAAADRGTLFLDEVAELSLESQSKLLQFLQSGQYYPLGSSQPRSSDVRVIAATNVDVVAEVAAKRFREDLYYRLHVIPIRLPALAERRSDIGLIASHCAARSAESFGSPPIPLSGAAITALEVDDWPGNIRQLSHTIEAGVLRAVSEGAEQVECRHLFPERRSEDPEETKTFQQAVNECKRRILVRALDRTSGNVTQAAKDLEMARSQINKLIRRFEIEIVR